MKSAKLALVLLILTSCFVVETRSVEAARRKRVSRSHSARPMTGYGANLHRRFVLKQEIKRASHGKRVRYRGNIRWR